MGLTALKSKSETRPADTGSGQHSGGKGDNQRKRLASAGRLCSLERNYKPRSAEGFFALSFSGESVFEPEPAPAGPVVVFGAGPSYAVPFSLIPDHPVSLFFVFDMPVVLSFFTASEFEFVMAALSCWPAGTVVCA